MEPTADNPVRDYLVPNAPAMDTSPTPLTPDVAVGGKETQGSVLRRSSRVRHSNVCYPEEEYDLS